MAETFNVDGSVLMGYLRQHPSCVAFLVLGWTMIRLSKWNLLNNTRLHDMSYLSYPHLCCSLPFVPVPPRAIRTSEQFPNMSPTMQTEVLAMQFRTVVQLLNQYRQLDLSRVSIMKDIIQLVQEIFRNDSTNEIATSAPTKDKTVANPYTISTNSMNRLLENLWNSVELVDSNTSMVQKGVKKSSKGTHQSDQMLRSNSGIETLRQEFDCLKEAYAGAEESTASEVSFLKWAAGGVPAQYAFNTIVNTKRVPTSTTNTSLGTSRPTTAATQLPSSPTKDSTTQPPSPLPTPKDTATHSLNPATDESLLSKSVTDSTAMMGELEEFMLELMDSGGIQYEELCDISMSIDASFSECGLSMDAIDQYCGRFYSEDTNDESVNLFEHLDSTIGDSLDANLENSDAILYRHLQQQYVVPVASSQTELNNLRQLHGHTMRRTANACAKYSPFEIVWRDDKMEKRELK